MQKLTKTIIPQTSVRLNVVVICGVVLTLVVSLGVMFYYSHEALHQEARLDAEQSLEAHSQSVDNILRSVEQSTGNIYMEMMTHLDQPERMSIYCRRLVECNPYISGCAICFKPDYYPDRHLFMTYVHQKGGVARNGKPNLVISDKYGSKPYTEYLWYQMPMTTGRASWTNPLPEEEDEGLTLSFCLPIQDQNREPVGALVADLKVDQLSQEVLSGKSTPSMFSLLIGSDGSLIVHPDRTKQRNMTINSLTENDPDGSARKVIDAMMAGETGYKPFRLNGEDWYAFYKPFVQAKVPNRATEKLDWSIGVVYSEDAVFGNFNRLLAYVVVIAILALLLFFVLVRIVMRRQMRPVRQLTEATKRVAEGHYDESMPDINRDDEIGLLYKHFQLMKQSLAAHVKELEQLTGMLKNRREVMHEIYAKEQSVDRVKSSFLHYVTNQMIAPAKDIEHYAATLSRSYRTLSPQEIDLVVSSLDKKSDSVLELINQMLSTADAEANT